MKKKKAFTLIELIIVIAIIAILAAIAIPVSSKLIEKAKVAQLEGDIKLLQSAAVSTYNETERYVDYNSEIYISTVNGKVDINGATNTVFRSLIEGKLNLPFGGFYAILDKQSKDSDGQGRYAQLYMVFTNISDSAKAKLKKDLDGIIEEKSTGQFEVILGKY